MPAGILWQCRNPADEVIFFPISSFTSDTHSYGGVGFRQGNILNRCTTRFTIENCERFLLYGCWNVIFLFNCIYNTKRNLMDAFQQRYRDIYRKKMQNWFGCMMYSVSVYIESRKLITKKKKHVDDIASGQLIWNWSQRHHWFIID